MAGLDEETDIGIHEGYLHSHLATIGENSSAIAAAPLDEAEDVVPPDICNTTTMREVHACICFQTHLPQFKPEECCLNSNRISSIWKAAGNVSIKTVPLIVPWGM